MVQKGAIMRFYMLLLLGLIGLRTAVAQVVDAPLMKRPRVGVVLSGGGAKGAAHIGVLRAIEEAGVKVDYVVGTSMGAVIGGLYAMGYTPAQLDSLMRTLDWEFIMKDKAPRKELSPVQRERSERYMLNVPLTRSAKAEWNGLVRGRNWSNAMARLTVGYHDSISFDSLRIPFACVATNLANGDEVVLRSGVLAKAIRASMAFPGALTPEAIGGMTLIDGGMVNNFPVDVARKMGADVVIGATVQRTMADTMTNNGPQGVISQLFSIASRHKYEDNVKDCDIYIGVNPKGVGTMDFDGAHIDTMLHRGYETTRQHWMALRDLAQRCGHCDSQNVATATLPRSLPKHMNAAAAADNSTVYNIGRICFEKITPAEERMIRRACKLQTNSTTQAAQIDKAVRLLGERFLYQDSYYTLTPEAGAYTLTLHAGRRLASQIGVGARFDTEELASILCDGLFVFHTAVPTMLDVSARLSEQYGAQVALTVEPWLNRQLNVFYSFRHHDLDVNHKGKRAVNLVYQQQRAGISFANRWWTNFDLEAGMQLYRYDFADVLFTEGEPQLTNSPTSDTYFSAFLRLKYNSQNKAVYPTRGSKMLAEYAFVTDNLTHFKRPHSFSAVLGSWETVVGMGERWAVLPRVSGRFVLSPSVPYVFGNRVGGWQRGKYMDQQLPFPGLSYVEEVGNALLMADVRLRYNFMRHQYATLQGAVMADERDVKHLKEAHYNYGVGLQYGYDTKFGPVEAAISYSGRCKKPAFYINIGYAF